MVCQCSAASMCLGQLSCEWPALSQHQEGVEPNQPGVKNLHDKMISRKLWLERVSFFSCLL